MITRIYGLDFHSDGGALTLDSSEVTDEPFYALAKREYTKTHEDGWTITGIVYEDYFEWVNDFAAEHPTFGKVWGDFERVVYADTLEGYEDFKAKHPPHAWDYGDI